MRIHEHVFLGVYICIYSCDIIQKAYQWNICLCVYIFICMFIFRRGSHVYMFICIYVWESFESRTCISIEMWIWLPHLKICKQKCFCLFIRKNRLKYIYMFIHIYIHTTYIFIRVMRIHILTQTYIHIYLHTIHTYISTYTQRICISIFFYV